ncbi:MAG: hypothetical protein B7X90_01245 [Novosphingobium sp. 17-62-19]|uniref:hypothetical protein n=1 Tax=Novosphingobium sp. 17-62-19 TaxID=1970406 RepID=UPI000BDC12F7|nr:hypothetical protein [Novosphingobium sp. 17-62-19]OZA21533.1 MAG: hypothetical protein B7X90_01245 [Novosphingobium sp. 17-62-19]HQS95135.1 hypothetical protein [Novosphingobium sp.]
MQKAELNKGDPALGVVSELKAELAGMARQLADLTGTMHTIIDLLGSIRADGWQVRAVAESMQISAALAADGRYADPKSLARFNRRMYSQQGEDGVIAEIFSRIGVRDRTFLEFGIGDGRENTTRFLLERGWRGFWLEGSPGHVDHARDFFRPYIESGQLSILQAFITAENINDLLDEVGVPQELDYMSIDIDYNTSHVWKAVNRTSRVACVEYNCTLPPNEPVCVPYNPEAIWDGTAWYGASLKVFEQIGAAKGMALVGCDLVGVNAYFVKHDEAFGKFREPFTAETHYEPPRFYSFGAQHGAPTTPKHWVSE